MEQRVSNKTNQKLNALTLLLDDDINRNLAGLKNYFERWPGNEEDKNAITEWSNYGEIGHPVWKLISEIYNSNGAIKNPIAFILSRMNNQ